jgi:hypothetical protein
VWSNGDTAVTCTIGSEDFTCDSGDATAVIPAVSFFAIKASVTGSGEPVPAAVMFAFRCLVDGKE